MSAAFGNKYSSKQNRLVGDVLRKIAIQNPKRLQRACERLLKKAEKGDTIAFREFADRVDGKPVQATVISGEDGVISVIHRVVIDDKQLETKHLENAPLKLESAVFLRDTTESE